MTNTAIWLVILTAQAGLFYALVPRIRDRFEPDPSGNSTRTGDVIDFVAPLRTLMFRGLLRVVLAAVFASSVWFVPRLGLEAELLLRLGLPAGLWWVLGLASLQPHVLVQQVHDATRSFGEGADLRERSKLPTEGQRRRFDSWVTSSYLAGRLDPALPHLEAAVTVAMSSAEGRGRRAALDALLQAHLGAGSNGSPLRAEELEELVQQHALDPAEQQRLVRFVLRLSSSREPGPMPRPLAPSGRRWLGQAVGELLASGTPLAGPALLRLHLGDGEPDPIHRLLDVLREPSARPNGRMISLLLYWGRRTDDLPTPWNQPWDSESDLEALVEVLERWATVGRAQDVERERVALLEAQAGHPRAHELFGAPVGE